MDNCTTYTCLSDKFFVPSEEPEKLYFLYCNIRSMRSNFNTFLSEIDIIKHKLSFIVLSEVWIGSNEMFSYKIPGFSIVGNCNDSYRAGGVICFVHNSISFIKHDFCMNTADCLLLEISINSLRFNIFSIYRLQQFSEYSFTEELNNKLHLFKLNTIYLGDINLDLMKNSNTSFNYNNIMSINSFYSLINCPTRITNTSATCVDHIFVKFRNVSCFKQAIFDVGVTDHCMLGLSYNVGERIIINNTSLCNSMKLKYNYDGLKHELESFNWDYLYSLNDVNECFDYFIDTLSYFIKKNTTQCYIRTNGLIKAKNRSPWISLNILNRIKKRNRLYNLFKKRPYDIDFKCYYNSFVHNLKQDIDNAKNAYFGKLISDCNGDSGKQWKIINSLTGNVKSRNVDRLTLDNGVVISDPKVVADKLNEYFQQVSFGIDFTEPYVVDLNQPGGNGASLFILPTDAKEIANIFSSLSIKKSTGYKHITVQLLKSISYIISPILSYIINLSFQTGVFPDALKKSIIIPILKKSNCFTTDNIRPISQLSIFSKIFEKCMKVRLINYLNRINFQNTNQFGFTKNKSTEDALVNFVNSIYCSLNLNLKTTGLFVDFRKAFDLVQHNILLSKMEHAGVRGNALNWFRSFLNGRTQQTRINNELSSSCLVTSGVPQGSVLSANLFIIFINDLLNVNFIGKPFAFADDIAFLYSNSNKDNIFESITSDLHSLRRWCIINKMLVNVNKTKMVNFDHKGFHFDLPVKYHKSDCNLDATCFCEPIELVSSFKYLGVFLDEKMSWRIHTKELNKILRNNVRQFYFLRNFCDVSLLRSLYFGLINSRIQYGIVCWGGGYKTVVNAIRKTQNQFLRIILRKSSRERSFPLYLELNVLPLQHLFIFKTLRLFYTRSGNRGSCRPSYHVRSNLQRNFIKPKVNKSIFKHSFSFLGPHLFNQLPLDIKLSGNLKQFCTRVYKWLIQFYDVSFVNVSVI